MRDFRKHRGKTSDTGRFFALCAGVMVVLALTVFSGQAAWGMYVKFTVASRGDEEAQTNLSQLNAQYTQMSAQVAALSTSRGQEGEIRERFGVAQPGEGAIDIIRTATTTGGQDTQPTSFWSKILHAFVVW